MKDWTERAEECCWETYQYDGNKTPCTKMTRRENNVHYVYCPRGRSGRRGLLVIGVRWVTDATQMLSVISSTCRVWRPRPARPHVCSIVILHSIHRHRLLLLYLPFAGEQLMMMIIMTTTTTTTIGSTALSTFDFLYDVHGSAVASLRAATGSVRETTLLVQKLLVFSILTLSIHEWLAVLCHKWNQ